MDLGKVEKRLHRLTQRLDRLMDKEMTALASRLRQEHLIPVCDKFELAFCQWGTGWEFRWYGPKIQALALESGQVPFHRPTREWTVRWADSSLRYINDELEELEQLAQVKDFALLIQAHEAVAELAAWLDLHVRDNDYLFQWVEDYTPVLRGEKCPVAPTTTNTLG